MGRINPATPGASETPLAPASTAAACLATNLLDDTTEAREQRARGALVKGRQH